MTPGRDAEARAGAVFEALADPTRRAVLRDVAEQGPRTATELAADLPVTRQAVAKHLAVLRDAGPGRATSGRAARPGSRPPSARWPTPAAGSPPPAPPGTTAWPAWQRRRATRDGRPRERE